MITVTAHSCDTSHGEVGAVMAAHPVGPQPGSNWYPGSTTYGHAYLLAAMRAGVIALVLLATFIAIVWF